jgi:hypothetical protein
MLDTLRNSRVCLCPHVLNLVLNALGQASLARFDASLKMESVAKPEPAFLTFTSAISVVYLLAILGAAYAGANRLLPARAPRADRLTFVWLVSPRLYFRLITADTHQVFDALIHFSFEGAFLYCSLFGRQANTSTGFLADLGKSLVLVLVDII